MSKGEAALKGQQSNAVQANEEEEATLITTQCIKLGRRFGLEKKCFAMLLKDGRIMTVKEKSSSGKNRAKLLVQIPIHGARVEVEPSSTSSRSKFTFYDEKGIGRILKLDADHAKSWINILDADFSAVISDPSSEAVRSGTSPPALPRYTQSRKVRRKRCRRAASRGPAASLEPLGAPRTFKQN